MKFLVANIIMLTVLLNPARVFASEAVIQIKPVVEVDGKRDVTLGDLVELRGVSNEMAAVIRDIRLADAPGVGETRTFSDVGLSQTLRVHLREIVQKTGETASFKIPSRVTVVRKSFRLTPEQVEQELQAQFKGICAECEFEVSGLSLPAIGKDLAADVVWKIKTRPELPKGSFSVPLEIVMNDGQKRTFWISGSLMVKKNVPIAARAIGIGEKLGSEDFALQMKDVTFASDAPATAGEISSSLAARQIPVGQVIFKNHLRKEMAVKSGDIVKVLAGNDEWQVSIDGVAQSQGYIGDLIRVKIPRTQKVLSGLLKEKGLVEVQ